MWRIPILIAVAFMLGISQADEPMSDEWISAWRELDEDLIFHSLKVDFRVAGLVDDDDPRPEYRVTSTEIATALAEFRDQTLELERLALAGIPLPLEAPGQYEIPGHVRTTLRILRADAHLLWTLGQTEDATNRLIAACTLGITACDTDDAVMMMTGMAVGMAAIDSMILLVPADDDSSFSHKDVMRMLTSLNQFSGAPFDNWKTVYREVVRNSADLTSFHIDADEVISREEAKIERARDVLEAARDATIAPD